MSDTYIVRLISSEDHNISKSELLRKIKSTGSDKYDSGHKQIFNDFYKKHDVDFFGIAIDDGKLNASLPQLKRGFAQKTQGDRGRRVVPDIAIIYKVDGCEMITNVYKNVVASDCFRFKTNAMTLLRKYEKYEQCRIGPQAAAGSESPRITAGG